MVTYCTLSVQICSQQLWQKRKHFWQPDTCVMEHTVQMTKMWVEEVQIYKMDPGELHILSTKNGLLWRQLGCVPTNRAQSSPVWLTKTRQSLCGWHATAGAAVHTHQQSRVPRVLPTQESCCRKFHFRQSVSSDRAWRKKWILTVMEGSTMYSTVYKLQHMA